MDIAHAQRLAEEIFAERAPFPVHVAIVESIDFLDELTDDTPVNICHYVRSWVESVDEETFRERVCTDVPMVVADCLHAYGPTGLPDSPEAEARRNMGIPIAEWEAMMGTSLDAFRYHAMCINPRCPSPRELFMKSMTSRQRKRGRRCSGCGTRMRTIDRRDPAAASLPAPNPAQA